MVQPKVYARYIMFVCWEESWGAWWRVSGYLLRDIFEAFGRFGGGAGRSVLSFQGADENRLTVTLFEGLWVEPLGVATELASHSSPLRVSIQCPGGLPDAYGARMGGRAAPGLTSGLSESVR